MDHGASFPIEDNTNVVYIGIFRHPFYPHRYHVTLRDFELVCLPSSPVAGTPDNRSTSEQRHIDCKGPLVARSTVLYAKTNLVPTRRQTRRQSEIDLPVALIPPPGADRPNAQAADL